MRTARTLEAEWKQGFRGSVSMELKEDESSTGRILAAGFYLVTARSRLARVFKCMHRLFLSFSIFFRAAVNRGYGGTSVFKTQQ
jgi:hypothetical protein